MESERCTCLARRTGLIEPIDRRLHLLRVHLPYQESDHVLNMAYNLLAGGTVRRDPIRRWALCAQMGGCRLPAPGIAFAGSTMNSPREAS